MKRSKKDLSLLTKYLMLGCFALTTQAVLAQTATIVQTVRGKVLDETTQLPLAGATVQLLETNFATATDTNGVFRIENVPVGKYLLKVRHLGYEGFVMPELRVESGKEVVLEVILARHATDLQALVVRGERPVPAFGNIQTITVEQTRRFAATFYDPARLAMAYAGVIGTNDQANGLVVRGNSPNAVVWQLEGVPIVNPNHTPNAGTFSDRAAQSSGGVNILSAQMLGTTYLLTGAFPPAYGDAVGGVLDMRLRKGNNERSENTVQMGLIGMDVAVESPLTPKGGSVLSNIRYSTVGLLAQMGVPLGDEAINFYDAAVNIAMPTSKIGNFNAFGIWGRSTNRFEAPRARADIETEKDQTDVGFRSATAIGGLVHERRVRQEGNLRTVLIMSGVRSAWQRDFLDSAFAVTATERDENDHTKLGLRTTYTHGWATGNKLRIGAMFTREWYRLAPAALASRPSLQMDNAPAGLVHGFGSWEGRTSNRFTYQVGGHWVYYTYQKKAFAEPRLGLRWQPSASVKHHVEVSYGRHSQVQNPALYRLRGQNVSGEMVNLNRSLKPIQADHFVLGYEWDFSPVANLALEAFYQSLFSVPVASTHNENAEYSVLNEIEGFFLDTLRNTGKGRNYGLEMTLNRFLANGWYGVFSTTFYQSKYTTETRQEHNTRFNGRFAAKLAFGKEWEWFNKREFAKTLGINATTVWVGGMPTAPIDLESSTINGTTVFDLSDGFALKQPDFFKTDWRIYYKTNRLRTARTWALDIQNATNRRNIAFEYFDTFQQRKITKYQLGLIPILTWRIEF